MRTNWSEDSLTDAIARFSWTLRSNEAIVGMMTLTSTDRDSIVRQYIIIYTSVRLLKFPPRKRKAAQGDFDFSDFRFAFCLAYVSDGVSPNKALLDELSISLRTAVSHRARHGVRHLRAAT